MPLIRFWCCFDSCEIWLWLISLLFFMPWVVDVGLVFLGYRWTHISATLKFVESQARIWIHNSGWVRLNKLLGRLKILMVFSNIKLYIFTLKHFCNTQWLLLFIRSCTFSSNLRDFAHSRLFIWTEKCLLWRFSTDLKLLELLIILK